MNSYFVDLHIHIGRTEQGEPVKISGSRDLTFYHIAREASERKGIEVIGIIDCQSPAVQREIAAYLDKGEMTEQAGGGIRYRQTTVLLGSEIEIKEPGFGAVHLLAYMPDLERMSRLTEWLRPRMKNVSLSSQRLYASARELQERVAELGGLTIPAHIFTPHKSLYGSGTDRLDRLLDPEKVAAVELGLSSDTEMAGRLSELDRYAYVTNSDAHSLAKIGREYNRLELAEPSFAELKLALAGAEGRRIAANFGLNPRLGKYHRTYCSSCESIVDERQSATERCLYCGSVKIVRGVADRIAALADRVRPDPAVQRPPYHFQVPLEFIPGLGPKKIDALLAAFGTEMNVVHRVPEAELAAAVGADIAEAIAAARTNGLQLDVGGGGRYGKVARSPRA